MGCRPIRRWQSTGKSELIAEMIGAKLKKEFEPKVKELGKDQHLQAHVKQYLKAKAEFAKAKELLQKREKELGIYWDKYATSSQSGVDKGAYRVHPDKCFIPDKVKRDLQRAANLSALGNRLGAKIIWDNLVAEYDLKDVSA